MSCRIVFGSLLVDDLPLVHVPFRVSHILKGPCGFCWLIDRTVFLFGVSRLATLRDKAVVQALQHHQCKAHELTPIPLGRLYP